MDRKSDYYGAKTKCKADNAYLATPRSYNENHFLIHTFKDTNLWIGINDISREGHYVSEDGHSVSYFRWGTNEPSNSNGNEDAVHIVGDSYYGVKGKWNDIRVDKEFRFVCFHRIN